MGGVFAGLQKTRRLLGGASANDDVNAYVQNLHDGLIMADAGAACARDIADSLRAQAGLQTPAAARRAAVALVAQKLSVLEAMLHIPPPSENSGAPFVLAVFGTNGGGKTTTIGKLAHYYSGRGMRVFVAAGDTFRAAAREQLQAWAKRAGAELFSFDGDSAAVAYDAAAAAKKRGADLLIVDTAGRLPAQENLMREAEKITRALGKALPGAPHERLLTLDATVGQNGLAQIKAFSQFTGISGVVITKLDSGAKGGVALALAETPRPLPVRFLGVGEGAEDLAVFNADEYADAMIVGESAAG